MKQPVKAKPVLTLAQAKKQISVLKGKVTKLDNSYQNEVADRIYAVQQMRTLDKEKIEAHNQLARYADDNRFLIGQRNSLQNELKAMQLVSDIWKKNYLELQEYRMNTPWNWLKTWLKTF